VKGGHILSKRQVYDRVRMPEFHDKQAKNCKNDRTPLPKNFGKGLCSQRKKKRDPADKRNWGASMQKEKGATQRPGGG